MHEGRLYHRKPRKPNTLRRTSADNSRQAVEAFLQDCTCAIDPTGRAITRYLAALMTHFSRDDAWPSARTIAEHVGCSRRTVLRRLRELSAPGPGQALVRERRGRRANGTLSSWCYRLSENVLGAGRPRLVTKGEPRLVTKGEPAVSGQRQPSLPGVVGAVPDAGDPHDAPRGWERARRAAKNPRAKVDLDPRDEAAVRAIGGLDVIGRIVVGLEVPYPSAATLAEMNRLRGLFLSAHRGWKEDV